ncbi:MAG: hypothetical protein ACXAC5_03840 [Promethearchaeota archaeon]
MSSTANITLSLDNPNSHTRSYTVCHGHPGDHWTAVYNGLSFPGPHHLATVVVAEIIRCGLGHRC